MLGRLLVAALIPALVLGQRTVVNESQTILGTQNYCEDAGASDAYACSIAGLTALTKGTIYSFLANTANTGAATINFSSLGAKTIKKAQGGITTDLADNDIRAGQIVRVQYDGTNMQMQSTLGNAPSGGSSSPSKTSFFPWGGTERITNSMGPVSGTTAWVIPFGTPAKLESATVRARLAASGASDGVVFGVYEKTASDTLTLRASTSAVVGSGAAVDVEPAWNSGAWVSAGILTLDPTSAVGEWFFIVGVEGANFVAAAGDALDWIRASSSIWGRTAGGALSGTGTGLTLPATIAPSGLTASTTTAVPVLSLKRF